MELVVYIPIIATSLFLVIRHGFHRRAGWIFLLIFGIVRVVGASMHIASEGDPTSIALHVGYSILEGAGMSPLLLATIGFLSTAAANGLDRNPKLSRNLHLLGLVASIALVLTIVGGTKAGTAKSASDLNSANNLRHIGVIIFVVLFFLVCALTGFFWGNLDMVMKNRRKLLLAITISLPFLAVRILYSVLSSYAPTTIPGSPPSPPNSLSKFNSVTGDWGIYLFMAVIMEFIVVLTYTITGILTPLKNDYAAGSTKDAWSSEVEMNEPML